MSTVIEDCAQYEDSDCEETHVFPTEGTRVRVREDYETRAIGDDTYAPVHVKAGETGVALSYVVEWHDVEVALFSRDGLTVWIDPDSLEALPDEDRAGPRILRDPTGA